MSATFALTQVQGNLGQDPEIKYTPSGTALANFSLAVSERYTTQGGEKREETHWIPCVCWGRTAELLGEYCKKGSSVFLQGRLKVEEWTDKDTQKKRSKMVVNVDRLLFNHTKRDGDEGGREERRGSYAGSYANGAGTPAPNSGGGYRRPPQAPPRPAADPDLDAQPDDIPF